MHLNNKGHENFHFFRLCIFKTKCSSLTNSLKRECRHKAETIKRKYEDYDFKIYRLSSSLLSLS